MRVKPRDADFQTCRLGAAWAVVGHDRPFAAEDHSAAGEHDFETHHLSDRMGRRHGQYDGGASDARNVAQDERFFGGVGALDADFGRRGAKRVAHGRPDRTEAATSAQRSRLSFSARGPAPRAVASLFRENGCGSFRATPPFYGS